ncbi:MAG: hypothetical protein KGJ57_19580 [Sphingomonadales bacterium]|nr:hypothetical protein [Sphingomonadales bacterium]MDE2171596.1 hypothetical protein [Sphingomonadales bacterium]
MTRRITTGSKALIAALCLVAIPAIAHGQNVPDGPTVRCPDGADACLAVPGVAVPPTPGDQPVIVTRPGPWSAVASFGLAPRDGGPTGVYESAELRRQIGHGYVQAGAMHYVSPTLDKAMSVSSRFAIGTVAGGTQIGSWLLDGYVSYGWQDFGKVRVPSDDGTGFVTRAANGPTGSPYYGAGVSIGRIVPLGQRWFVTPTGSVVYAWGRWLHPAEGPGGQDFTSGETTWTGTARLRVDRVMGRSRRSYLGLSVAEVYSSNASSFAGAGGAIAGGGGGAVGPGLGDAGTGTLHLRDGWVEIAGHASLAVSRLLRIEASAVRTLGLVTGNTTTISMGLRRQF